MRWDALGKYSNSRGTAWQPQGSTGTLVTVGESGTTWHQATLLKPTEIKMCFPDEDVQDATHDTPCREAVGVLTSLT